MKIIIGKEEVNCELVVRAKENMIITFFKKNLKWWEITHCEKNS